MPRPNLPSKQVPRHRAPRYLSLLASSSIALSCLSATAPIAHAAGSLTDATRAARLPHRGHEIQVGDRSVRTPAPPPAEGTGQQRSQRALADADPTFIVTYSASFSSAQRQAFQAAVDEWGSLIRTPVPIRISASISDLGPGVLGGAGPNGWFEVPSGDPGVIYPQALANAMSGYDVDPSSPDISAVFDDDAAGAGWYLGTDGNPPSNQYDFESTVMHEIGHGLGFYATADSDVTGCPQSTGCFGLNAAGGDTQPSEFDTHLSRGLGGARLLVNQGGRAWASALAPNMTGALLSVFQSQSIYYRGLFTDLAAGATPARLYAPSSWVPASSISHLDEATYPAGSVEALMTPAMERGESSHAPGPITLGIMADLGWHVPSVVDAPNTAFIRAGMVDFLDRLPTASEEAQYRDDLGRHALSRYAFVNLLAKSPEWITARVNDLYVSTLHRPADSAGLTYWSTLVSQGRLTIAQLAATLYASDESFQVSGHRDVDTWIGFLYSDLLGRQPDPAGLSYWAAVTQAQGRQATAIALYQSAESRSRRVDGLYSTLLGRGADSGGRSFWTNYLSNGDDVTLAAQLAASDEYFLRSMSRGL